MTTPNLSLNPMLTTTGAGSFLLSSDGVAQGLAMDDPALRNELAGGTLATSETIPMWAGMPIYEQMPASNVATGSIVGRAASNGAIAGFSVANQAYAWLTTPQSECPSAGGGMTIPFYRLGCGIRIPVGISAALFAALTAGGGATTTQVSWNFANYQLDVYSSGVGALPVKILGTYVTGKVITYDNVNNYVHFGAGPLALVQL